MQKLDNVTLILVDTKNYGRAIYSLKKSLEQITPAKTLFFTNLDIDAGEGITVVHIPEISSKEEYSRFIIKELWMYIKTDYVLVTQWDGWVLDGNAWNPEFLEYDYIGAPWVFEHGRNIGNGGFSLRSLKLCKILGTDPLIEVVHPEDQSIGILYRGYLEQRHGIKFPSEELADTFAYELKAPIVSTFGFHSYFHKPYQPTVVIVRHAALGDVVQVEPVLCHFYLKGYRVVFESLPQFQNLFIQHYFKVHKPEEIDGRLLENAKRYDLDFSYESNPKQLHLKTYYEYCEVPESEMVLRNPRLTLNIPIDPSTKLFKKYCVLHIVERKQKARNIQGDINWAMVITFLKVSGYDIIQIGGGDPMKGTLQMMTPGEPFLMWVIRSADLFLGVDSGPSNIAVAFNVPAVIFFGSVEPKYIYADLSNIEPIQYENVCKSPKCWHSLVSSEGAECVENIDQPPCVQYTTDQVLTAINKIINK